MGFVLVLMFFVLCRVVMAWFVLRGHAGTVPDLCLHVSIIMLGCSLCDGFVVRALRGQVGVNDVRVFCSKKTKERGFVWRAFFTCVDF